MLERSQASVWQFIYDATEARKHTTDEDPWASEWLKSHPCGYGPFFVDTFTPGEQVVYRANEKYHAGRPKVDEVIFRQVPSSSTRTALIAQGEVDVATTLRPDELARLEKTSGVRVLYFRGNYLTYMVPNQRRVEAFTDARVRQALAYATPQAEIGEAIYNDRGQRMDSVIPSTYPTYDPQFFSYEYDPNRAKQLLAEAGYGQGLSFSAMYTDVIPELEDLGIMLRTAYERIGVRMELERQPAATYFDTLYGPNKDYETALSRELAVVPDPVHATYQFFYSKSPINTAGVDDPELDELLLQSLCEPAASREPIFSDIQQKVMDAALWIPVWAPGNQFAIRENVQGFTWQFNNGFTWHLASVT
jgi:peptide/nickel transport system substrate-binding protein